MTWSAAARAAAAAARRGGGASSVHRKSPPGLVRKAFSEMVFDRAKVAVTPRQTVAKLLKEHRARTKGAQRKNWMDGLITDFHDNGTVTIAKPAARSRKK